MDAGTSQNPKNYQIQGRFMYADYSPLEDDRNLVDIVKDFILLVSKLSRIDINNKKLGLLLSDSDGLRTDIIAAIKQIRTNTTFTMDKFYNEHSDVLANDLLTTGGIILVDTKNSLSELLGNTETSFDQQHTRYKENLLARINENNSTASNMIQSWLAGDYRNLPRPIVSNLVVTTTALIDRNDLKSYGISRTTRTSTAAGGTVHAALEEEKKGDRNEPSALQFFYTYRIDGSDLEFWGNRRTVAELGIRELTLPVGMKAPISEKIKQSFRFGSRKDVGISKEPELVKVDNYHLLRVSLEGDKTLSIELAEDAARADTDLFRISYDLGTLSNSAMQYEGQQFPSSAISRPKIDYLFKDNGGTPVTRSDILQIDEIQKNTDISKIQLLGAAILSKIRILQAPQIVQSRGRLEELKTHESEIVIPASLKQGDFASLFEFLESVASSFAPYIGKMKERTQVQGELTIREELGSGQRREFSVRLDDLKSQLKDSEYGNRIGSAMGL
jgi:hypothetical protein